MTVATTSLCLTAGVAVLGWTSRPAARRAFDQGDLPKRLSRARWRRHPFRDAYGVRVEKLDTSKNCVESFSRDVPRFEIASDVSVDRARHQRPVSRGKGDCKAGPQKHSAPGARNKMGGPFAKQDRQHLEVDDPHLRDGLSNENEWKSFELEEGGLKTWRLQPDGCEDCAKAEPAEDLERPCWINEETGEYFFDGKALSSKRQQDLDLGLSLRLLATLSYLLPVVDVWRFFAVGLASESWPTVYQAWMCVAAMLPQDLADAYATLHPLLLFTLAQIATRRRLPQLLRFNLYQAFLLDLATCVAFHASSLARWHSFTAGAIYVPTAAEPPIMPGGQVVLALFAACIAYSISSTLVGSLPDRIPYVSAEAAKSLGTPMIRLPKRTKPGS